MGLKKIDGNYCTISGGRVYEELDVTEIGEMVLFKAIERYFKTGEIKCEIVDMLRMEWDSVNLKKRDLNEIESAYREIALKCIGELQAHVTVL